MAAPVSVDGAAFLREHIESASPDLLRAMVKTFAEAASRGVAFCKAASRSGRLSGGRVPWRRFL